MNYEFRLPDVGEGIAEAEIVRWLVGEGEPVVLDQPLAEIQTDKAVVEVPAPVAGVVVAHGAREGEIVQVGELLVTLRSEGTDAGGVEAVRSEERSLPVALTALAAPQIVALAAPAALPVDATLPPRRPLATPAVRKQAREHGIDLATLRGSGAGGRITAGDVLARAAVIAGAATPAPEAVDGARSAPRTAAPETAPATPGESVAVPPADRREPAERGAEERVPLRGLRRRIAEAMTASWRTIPHITGMDEFEVSALVRLRDQLQPAAEAAGARLTYLPFIVKAVVAALKQYPILNAWLDEVAGEIVYRRRFNIGIATATPDGLIVPVLHDADRLTLRELQARIIDLSEQARTRRIALADLQGGSFTITNFGAFGGRLATPIIRPGEAAILGTGRIQERPWVIEGHIEARPVLALSLSADHRLIDGDVSTAFLSAVGGYLSDPLRLMLEMA